MILNNLDSAENQCQDFFPENYFSAAESFDVVIFKRGAFSLTALTSLGRKLPFHLKKHPLKKNPLPQKFYCKGGNAFLKLCNNYLSTTKTTQ